MRRGMDRLQKIVGSIFVSAAVLAIANVETIWQGYHRDELREEAQTLAPKQIVPHIKLKAAVHGVKPLQSELSQTLEGDELKDANPYAELSTMDPLQQIMRRGVASYRRETYRSPDYQDEGGYDLVSYKIEHSDGSRSSILAYLEHPDGHQARNVGAPDQRIPFVIFMVSNGETSRYYFFRSGQLIEQSDLTQDEAQSLVSHRIGQGVPFFAVSR
jgi:hypothetical protein